MISVAYSRTIWRPITGLEDEMGRAVAVSWAHQVGLLPGVVRLPGPPLLERYPSPEFEGAMVFEVSGPVYWEGGEGAEKLSG